MIEKILKMARDQGLTQGELEKLCALPMNRVSKWKNGDGEPTARQLFRIATLLKVSMRYLVDDSMEKPTPEVDERQRIVLDLVARAGYDLAINRLMGLPEAQSPPAAGRQQEATTTIIRNDKPNDSAARKRIG